VIPRHVLAAGALCLAAACSSPSHPKELLDVVRVQHPIAPSVLPAEIPRQPLPVRGERHLAIAQPIGNHQGQWTAGEMLSLQGWIDEMVERGIVDSGRIVPPELALTTRKDSISVLQANARGAYLTGSNLLLTFTIADDYRYWPNALVVFNVTIIGMWLVPAHHRKASAAVEVTLIDPSANTVHAFARGAARDSLLRPFVYADRRDVRIGARLDAIQAARDPFFVEAQGLAAGRVRASSRTAPGSPLASALPATER
jgi:hypothetical protein